MRADQRETLVAAFGRVLPDDDSGPGANAADAVGFVERAMLIGVCRVDVARTLDGLHLLDDCSFAMHGVRFALAEPGQQDAVLARLRGAPHPAVLRFLHSLVRLTLAGYLCPPAYGGNRDGCGWAYVGYAPHARTRARDTATPHEPAARRHEQLVP